MSDTLATVAYTYTDEAPALATRALLPILRAFTQSSGVRFESQDISFAGRILASFPERLGEDQRVDDSLAELGRQVKRPEANVIKLPNISASIPQLAEAITELKSQGFDLPDFPSEPESDEQRDIRRRYEKLLGSAVNPVLREGNSDRRVAAPVKQFAKQHPHSMGKWFAESKTRVAYMSEGDFYGNERSILIEQDDVLRVEVVGQDGSTTVLKESIPVEAGDVIDATKMDVAKLRAFLADAIEEAKADDILLSLHLKSTMMKVSDPILFGHVVSVFYRDVFEKHSETLRQAGANVRDGVGQIFSCIERLPADVRAIVEADWAEAELKRPRLAMVNSQRGISNLHVPSDVIIDASMPAAIRAGGKMWGPDGQLHDTLAIIPDRCYARVYQAVIDDCKTHGRFDVATMGSVSNVGLMAKKAEEYGSHDKTFEMSCSGTVRLVNSKGDLLIEHQVATGDLWRACLTKQVAIVDWVRLGVHRARATGAPAVFWLDPNRAHDRQLIQIVDRCLAELETDGLEILVLSPVEAAKHACERARRGLDTISVTGNVLRDYLTDLFPILELGTSAKMLSIVPLLAGGSMFETGAGGSAPKHIDQFLEEGHLRWDSLGEYLAIAVSLEALAEKHQSKEIAVLAETLNEAVGRYLEENRSPSRQEGELDNRGSHVYLTIYWAEALAGQDQSTSLRERFQPIARALVENESAIIAELNGAQGHRVDLGGYYRPDDERANRAMRPSPTFNGIIDAIS